MPGRASFEEAASVCDGAILALNCLRPAGVRDGKTILVFGASGSIGTAAVQLAKQGLMQSGSYRPVIDGVYRLEEVVEATEYVETQQKTGNVVLTVA